MSHNGAFLWQQGVYHMDMAVDLGWPVDTQLIAGGESQGHSLSLAPIVTAVGFQCECVLFVQRFG